nr:alpha-1,2-fucosyltransferase [Treponema primitia]
MLINAKILKNVIMFDYEDANNIDVLLAYIHSYKNVYVGGWYFHVPALVKKFKDVFINKYTLKRNYYENNELLKRINQIKSNQIVVGVHIRRGDYKIFNDGKWYFDDNVYAKYMNNLRNEIKKYLHQECIFIIFSNELTTFKENDNTYISNNEWFIDQYLMSKCDFLIGPPSTFSMWANFIGKNKIYNINDDSGNIELNQFHYMLKG